jgi:hypothetical protein
MLTARQSVVLNFFALRHVLGLCYSVLSTWLHFSSKELTPILPGMGGGRSGRFIAT